jgi:hypothetical protein
MKVPFRKCLVAKEIIYPTDGCSLAAITFLADWNSILMAWLDLDRTSPTLTYTSITAALTVNRCS